MFNYTKSIGLISFLIFFPLLSQAQQNYGLFMIVKGEVKFQNPNSALEKAKVGSKVLEGATVITEKDSRAKVVMSDRNVFNFSPETKVVIQKYETSPGSKNVSVNLEQGKIRVNVEQKYDDKKEKFQLKTPTVVAGVRGTQFLAAYDSSTKQSQIVTFKGSVAMTSMNPAGQPINTVVIEKGQKSSAGEGQAPEAPVNLPKEEVRELDKASSSVAEPKRESSANTTGGSNTGEGQDKKESGGAPESKPNEAKVTNTKDLDTEIAKDIRVAPVGGTERPPPPLAPPPVINPVGAPRPPDFATGAVQNQNTTTKVTITVTK